MLLISLLCITLVALLLLVEAQILKGSPWIEDLINGAYMALFTVMLILFRLIIGAALVVDFLFNFLPLKKKANITINKA